MIDVKTMQLFDDKTCIMTQENQEPMQETRTKRKVSIPGHKRNGTVKVKQVHQARG